MCHFTKDTHINANLEDTEGCLDFRKLRVGSGLTPLSFIYLQECSSDYKLVLSHWLGKVIRHYGGCASRS